MKLKNILLSGLSLVLVAALAIGGTVAYLQDTDEAVNVMTLGNVSIEQLEYQRAEGVSHINAGAKKGDLVPFVQGQTLYPAVPANNAVEDYAAENGNVNRYFYWGEYAPGANGLWNDDLVSNVMDKFVFVKNTGKTDAYYRTVFAFECPEGMRFGQAPEQDGIERELMMNTNSYSAFTWDDLGYTVIGGTRYKLMVANYANVLEPNETSRPSLLQVLLTHKATNEDMALLGETYEILVFSQAVQAAGFADAETALNAAFGEITTTNHPWSDGVNMPSLVNNAEELQDAINNAKNGDTIILGDDIEGDVTVTQKEGVKFTINGNGKTIDGSIIVDGKSKRYETAGVTIKNVKFSSDNAAPDAYVTLGVSGNTNTRYTNNVTVSNCTFDYSGTGDKVAVKSYTGGDWNLTIENCTVNKGMHTLAVLTNVEKGLTITGCKVYSKNGINLNNTPYLNMSDCEFDTVGYCVRFGVNGATNNGNFTIANSTLKSANDEGDAVIIFRGTMTGATLNLKGTTLTGTLDITGDANIVK